MSSATSPRPPRRGCSSPASPSARPIRPAPRSTSAPPRSLSRGLIGNGKHKLAWRGLKGQIAKDKAKLLLNLVAVAPTAIPRGGDIEVEIAGTLAGPSFIVRCHGTAARPPQYLGDFVNGPAPPINALTIQAYYTVRLAAASRMRLAIVKDGADVLLTAKPAG